MTDESNVIDHPPADVLDRYLAGEASADERARVTAWYAGHPDREAMLAELATVLPGSHRPTAHVDVNGALRRLTARRLGHRDNATRRAASAAPEAHWNISVGGRRVPAPLVRPQAWIAGGVAAAIVAVLAWVAAPRNAHDAATAGPVQAYATAPGRRAVLTLHDGTRVTLAPRSELRVAEGFGRDARAVVLTGEAYFEVPRAAGAPFVVQTGAVRARVLGTAFMVRRYPGDVGARVAVTDGKVAVDARAAGRPAVVLTAGRVGTVTDSGTVSVSAGDANLYAGWLRGRLVFREAPVAEVLATLSRWYGYEFRLADPAIARQNLTAALNTQSSATALSTLKLLLDVDLTFDGNVVTLAPRRARGRAPAGPRDPGRSITPHYNEVGR